MGKDYWNVCSNLKPRISNIINCYSPVTCHLQFCTAQSRVLEYLHKSDMPHFEKPGARVSWITVNKPLGKFANYND